METSGGGILGRLSEKVLYLIAIAALVLIGFGIWDMGPQGRQAALNWLWNAVVWLVVALGLPWSAKLYIRRVLDAGANWVGLGLLAGLTLFDMLLGFFLFGWPAGGWSWLLGIGVAALAATYNYLVVEYLAQMAEG